jgi:putative SOS response-associated peptidase YedK
MCGRYAQYTPAEAIADAFDATLEARHIAPRYNAAPMQWLPVVRQRSSGERVVQLLRWGLVPHWAKDEGMATRLINARAETLADKPAFRAAFRRRRCIIPADGFYEWAKTGRAKQPVYIFAADQGLLAFAGIWERWTPPNDGEPIDTFSIVTTEANALIRPLHERMPVILAREAVAAWLDPDSAVEGLQDLLIGDPERRLSLHPVARAVGNVRHEGPELIAPLVAPMGDTVVANDGDFRGISSQARPNEDTSTQAHGFPAVTSAPDSSR